MSKEEIALELVKLVCDRAIKESGANGNFDSGKTVANLYNQILESISKPEQSK